MYFEETKLNDEKSFRSRFPLNKINIAIKNNSNAEDQSDQSVSTTLTSDSNSSFRNDDSIVHTEQFKLTSLEQTLLCTTHFCPYSHFLFGMKLTLIRQDSEPPR